MYHLKHANAIQSILITLEDNESIPEFFTPDDIVSLFDCMNDHFVACSKEKDTWKEYPFLGGYTSEERGV